MATISCSALCDKTSLDDGIEYYALSYYWGAPSVMETILVDGIEVQIRKTVFRFLQQLTYHFGSILVWLDALCINQKDVHERNWQVSMMGDLFKSAAGVYAWLGEGDGDCDYAISYAAQVDQPSSITKEFDENAVHEYFGHLLQRPYWTRVRVIQEVVLARRLWLLYGEKTITWDSFAAAFQRLLRSVPSEDSFIPNLDWGRVSQLVEARNNRDKERPDLFSGLSLHGRAGQDLWSPRHCR
jgi:Heterokaryon incompatibility protein (HET)